MAKASAVNKKIKKRLEELEPLVDSLAKNQKKILANQKKILELLAGDDEKEPEKKAKK